MVTKDDPRVAQNDPGVTKDDLRVTQDNPRVTQDDFQGDPGGDLGETGYLFV